jgi:hypothetical protein
MPGTKTITTYTLLELEGRAREKALNWLMGGSLDYWWENVFEDAARVGIKIQAFDTGRANDITGDFKIYDHAVAKRILAEHGSTCETYKLADVFLNELEALGDEDADDYDADKRHELEEGFKKALLKEFLSMLRQEEDYISSEEHLIEVAQDNEFVFDKYGYVV